MAQKLQLAVNTQLIILFCLIGTLSLGGVMAYETYAGQPEIPPSVELTPNETADTLTVEVTHIGDAIGVHVERSYYPGYQTRLTNMTQTLSL
jgi:hypothetical protein